MVCFGCKRIASEPYIVFTKNVRSLLLLDMHVCTCQREAPNIRNAKVEGVPHLPHTEIFRKWRENEEHDLHDANKYPD